MVKNQGHVKRKDLQPGDLGSFEEDYRRKGQQAENESYRDRLPGEEPRNVQKAGGGVQGKRLGGAHTGRSQSRPEEDLTKRKPYGRQ